MNVIKKLQHLMGSGQAGIVMTSVEPEEIFEDLQHYARETQATDDAWDVCFWDNADGLTDMYGNLISLDAQEATDEMSALGLGGGGPQKVGITETLEFVLNMSRQRQLSYDTGEASPNDDNFRILVIRNADRLLMPSQGQVDPTLLTYLQKIIRAGQGSKIICVLQAAPNWDLPPELEVHFEYVEHGLPMEDERKGILESMGISDISEPVSRATAGLSRAKTAQYAAETMGDYGYLNPGSLFFKKANHLSRASKLDVWSPEFVQKIRLWPKSEDMVDATDVMLVQEETQAHNKNLAENETRAKISYMASGKKIEQWLDPMPTEDFNSEWRPERDFFSLKSVVGLQGLKDFLTNGLRSDVPDRSRMKHVLMLGVPGTGKSFMMQCCSGEFNTPLSSMQASNLYSKWLGDTDKILAKMLETVQTIGGILAIDEFQRFLPQGGAGGESGGVENRLLGTLLTWLNNQQSNLVLSAANNISNLPDEITRSGRVDALVFVGFPGREAKDAAWQMYQKRHDLVDAAGKLPKDDHWTPADIMSCCRLAEMQNCSLEHASRWITPSYEKNQKQMDDLMDWAEGAGCICAETGERFKHPRKQKAKTPSKKMTRQFKEKAAS